MYYSYSKNWNVYFTKMLGGDLGILSSVLEKTSCREAGMMNNTKRVLSDTLNKLMVLPFQLYQSICESCSFL